MALSCAFGLLKHVVYLSTLSRLVIAVLIEVPLEHNFPCLVRRGLPIVELFGEVRGLIVPGAW